MKIVVLGSTGHVGRELTRELAARGHSVTAITRNPATLEGEAFSVAQADVFDTPRLRALFSATDKAFLLNPPAAPSGDTDTEERRTAEAIVSALERSSIAHVVAQSTWGARPGRGFGDLSTLHHFEKLLAAQTIPATIMRAAYLMSNWDGPIAAAIQDGELSTMLPEDLMLPMVSPRDLANVAADLLEANPKPVPVHVEGPERYSPQDVDNALNAATGQPVRCKVVPRSAWVESFIGMGFSPVAARSYADMTGSVVDEKIGVPEKDVRGMVTLLDHVRTVI